MRGIIEISEFGGPEKLKWREGPMPSAGPGEVLLRQTVVGLNFIDVYHRTGLYPNPLPFVPGLEACGVVEALGDGVTRLRVGERVAYPAGPLGAYATHRTMPADRLWRVPDAIPDDTAAAMMLKGCTAEYLIRRTFPVVAGNWVLFHAAAGGVGLIAVQWLRALGVHVIGTCGSSEKAALALENGLDHAILYRDEDFAERVREITDGRGVDVVYDSIGKDTFAQSLGCLKRRGTMVTFGNATGAVEAFTPAILNQLGGLYVTRPSIAHYYADAEDFAAGCAALGEMVESGTINIRIGQHFPLENAADAHRALEARATTGSTILTIGA
jgi:NADPH:quinone reductase